MPESFNFPKPLSVDDPAGFEFLKMWTVVNRAKHWRMVGGWGLRKEPDLAIIGDFEESDFMSGEGRGQIAGCEYQQGIPLRSWEEKERRDRAEDWRVLSKGFCFSRLGEDNILKFLEGQQE